MCVVVVVVVVTSSLCLKLFRFCVGLVSAMMHYRLPAAILGPEPDLMVLAFGRTAGRLLHHPRPGLACRLGEPLARARTGYIMYLGARGALMLDRAWMYNVPSACASGLLYTMGTRATRRWNRL